MRAEGMLPVRYGDVVGTSSSLRVDAEIENIGRLSVTIRS
jgi:hypothetical protein